VSTTPYKRISINSIPIAEAKGREEEEEEEEPAGGGGGVVVHV